MPGPSLPAAPAGLALSITDRAGPKRKVVTITLSGDLDIVTAPDLASRLTAVIDSGQREVRVDLCGLNFCDVTGLNVFVAARSRLVELGGSLTTFGPCPAMQILVDVLGAEVGIRLVRPPRARRSVS